MIKHITHPLRMSFGLLLLFAGCHKDLTGPEADYIGSGRIVSESRSLGTFKAISIESVGNVHFRQDSERSVRVEADDNILDRVSTRVENGLLSIGLLPGSYSHVTVDLYVSAPTLEVITISGAGSISCAAPLHLDSLRCLLSGAGSMTLSGSSVRQTILISGAGSVYSNEMVSSICSVTISGTGSAEVNVTQQLDAIVSGVGNVLYSGNPPVVHQQVSGIGNVIRRP